MFQVHIVNHANRTAYGKYLEQSFRIRHEIYVGERGWYDLDRGDGREIDAFDTDDAIYLLGIQPETGVVAGSRLVPSLRPHLMSDVFPRLAPAGVPRDSSIFEWTRIFVVPALRQPGQQCLAAGVMYCAILEFCLQQHIRQLTVVCEPYWFNRLKALGWNPYLLGDAICHRGETIIGLMLEMSATALSKTRERYSIDHSVLWTPPSPASWGVRSNGIPLLPSAAGRQGPADG
ncbi:acyl-homoserine-lactone synthase [Stappia sp. P2PMeth1]|uniref:acyl-homoserine-lactone synthase n=1 Tax=Stappia sp. P2PMeth1 TaxID=2003586 RepID=UPI0016452416|nr:acyl-homoserine-lactone synthase [Stappia sp. P2PMeth1]